MQESSNIDMGVDSRSRSASRASWHDALTRSRLLRGGRMTKWKGIVVSCAPHVAGVIPLITRTIGGHILPRVLLLGLTAGPAVAADVYWDVNRGITGQGGSGSWNLSDVTWNQSSDGLAGPFRPWNNVALDTAVFGGAAGTVALGGAINAGGLTFTTAGYTLNGGTLTLSGTAPTITTNTSAGGISIIESVIAGTAGLTKAGGGTLQLSGNNTFSGDISILGGRVYALSDAAFGGLSNSISTAAGADITLRIDGAGTSRSVTIGDGGFLRLNGAGVGSARIGGNGSVYVGASGNAATIVSLTNDDSSYTGQTIFNGCHGVCWAYFSSIADLGVASSLGAPTTVENGTVVFNQSSQYSDNVVYIGDGDSSNRNWDLNGEAAVLRNRGTGTLTITGDINTSVGSSFSAETGSFELLGTLSGGNYNFISQAGRAITLGGANSFTGQAGITGLVSASALADIGASSSLGTGSVNADIVLNDGTLSYTGGGASSNRPWTANGTNGILNDGSGALALSGSFSFNSTADSLTLGGTFTGTNTFSGAISGTGGVISDGAGTWVLGAANTFTGSVTVENGTLQAGNATAFGAASGFIVNGGTLDLGGHDLAATSLSGVGGSVALGTNTFSIDTEIDSSYAGVITGSGGFSKAGMGTLTLTGANTYTGDTSLSGGGLTLDFSASGAPITNIITAESTLSVAGGRLNIIGADGAINSQSFDGLNVTAGSTRVAATSGVDGSMSVDFGAITRTGGLVDFALPADGSFITSSTNLGGWATVNGTDYAKVSSGVITAFEAADYINKDNAGSWLTGEVISDTGGAVDTAFFGTVSASQQLGGLKYTAAANSTVSIADGQTLGIDGTVIVASSVGTAGQTIGGGSLTGGTGGETLGILKNGAGRFTINSTIVDNGGATGFTKGGDGIVTLGGANTYTGVTTLSGGRLEITSLADAGSASSIGAASADPSNLVLESGTLAYVSGVDSSTNRGLTLVDGSAVAPTIEVNHGSTIEFSGLVTSPDDAGLTKTGGGTLVLSNNANDYVGVTTVTGAGGAGGASVLSVGSLSDGGVASGIGAATGDPSNLVLAGGGSLQYTGSTVGIDRGFMLDAGGGRVDIAQAGTTLTISGMAVGVGGLIKEGNGVLVLTGANTYAGGTTVNDGTLVAGAAEAFGSQTAFMTVNTGGTLDLGGFDIKVGALRDGGVGGGSVNLGAATLTLGGTNGTFAGTISGSGGLTQVGGGTQTLSGCNNTYTGGTRITGGAISVDCLADGGEASGIGASTSDSANLVFEGGTLTYTGSDASIDRGFTLQSGVGGISVANAATTLEISGQATGAGQISKRGDGTLVLSGNNNYTGHNSVAQGVLRAGSNTAFGSGTAQMTLANTAGVALDLAGFDVAVGRLNGGGTIGGSVLLGSGTLTINNGTAIYDGAISGSGGIIKNGTGTQTQVLNGCASNYTGSTIVNGGILAVDCLADGGVNSAIGASTADASNLVLNGGTFQYRGTGGSTDRQFTLGGNAALDSSGTGAIAFTSNAPITFNSANTAHTLTLTGSNEGDNVLAAKITNNGTGETSLTKTSAGTWRLTNPDSTYTGVTRINGGVLSVDKLADGGQASSLGASTGAASNLVIGNNSTLRYTGTGDTTNRLFTLATGVTFIESSGTGAVVFENTAPVIYSGSGTRTVGLGGTNTDLNTMGGTISDGAGGATTLAKNGSGTWMLTGDNDYTGSTIINGGDLMVGNGGTTGNVGMGNVVVDSSTSTLSLNRSDTYSLAGTLSGPGTLAQIGTGTSVLKSTTNQIGATDIRAGTLQVDGGLTTPTMAMSGTSTLDVNGTVQAAGATQAAITGDTGESTINVNAGGILLANGDLGAGADTVNLTGTLDTGAGALALGDGNDTLVLNDEAQITGSVLAGAGTDLLQINNALAYNLDGASVGGFERLDKQNAGTLTLTGDHIYTDGTTIAAGTVQIGSGGTSGSLAGDVLDNGTLAFNRSDAYEFAGLISGTGGLSQIGAGTTTLTGDNSYTGPTVVQAGTLLVNGDQSAATGDATVASGATLGGTGTLGGNVSVAGGATLSPGTTDGMAGTLNINGDLALNDTSNLAFNFGEPNVVGGAFNDLVTVGGDLVLDGNLNVTQTTGGTFGAGIYRVISYLGGLTNNGVNLASTDYLLQTSVANQVNLVNTAGENLNFWDGGAGPQNDSVVNGGDGTWSRSADAQWTTDTGEINAPYSNGTFAIFAGAAGNVRIDNMDGQVEASGMQFAVDGYALVGDALTLVGGPDDPMASTIRVGDGTTEGADMIATIGMDLTGATTLVKTDLGTLVLSGANTYAGGTRIEDGTVSVSSDANLGDVAGAIEIDGGALQNTAAFASARGVTLEDRGATFQTDADLALSGAIDGTGALSKTGTGTLALSGVNSYAGGTRINEGTLSVSSDQNLGAAAGAITFDGGTLQNTAAFASARGVTLEAGGGILQTEAELTLSNVVDGAGALTKAGADTLVLSGTNTYAGGTTISSGSLQLGDGGASGSIEGDVANQGALLFNRSDAYSFDGQISGSGAVSQEGSGTTILTSNNTYAGQTTVQSGALLINGDQSGSTGLASVASGGALGGTGVVGGDVDVADGGALRPGGLGATPDTLTINGGLTLADTSALDYNFGESGVVGGAFNDLVTVGGDLTLDGVLNVTESAGGEFGPGLYRVISYDGTLTDNGLALGNMPTGDFRVQTSIAQQVNLVNATGLALNFWDSPAGGLNDNNIHGGDGEWNRSSSEYWTTDTGAINASYANGAFAVFAGEPGTVTVNNGDGAVEALGMQFATGGYTITGEDLALVGNASGVSTIRVGDGTLAGADMAATIEAALGGSSTLEKTDLGTLVLDGVNTYTGGTSIKGGTLQVSQDANLGDAAGAVVIENSTLHTTASFESGRNVDLIGTGTFRTDDSTELAFNGAFTGAGGLTKAGTGTLVMGGSSSYTGATTVAEGTLRAGGANAFSATSNMSVLAASEVDLAGHSQSIASLSNAGTVRLSGAPGTRLNVGGNYSGNDGLLVMNAVLGDDSSSTDRLVVAGNTSGNSALQVNNVGGGGAPTVEGIKVVEVGGASNGSFALQGDYVFEGDQAVVAGAYAYRLYQGGTNTPADGDWYLRSSLTNPVAPTDPTDPSTPTNPTNPTNPSTPNEPLYQPGVPVYEAYAGALQAFNQLGTLQQRVGSRSWKDPSGVRATPAGSIDASGIWMRVQASDASFAPDVTTSATDYDTKIWKLQTGIDGTLSENEAGRSVVGMYAQYGTMDSSLHSIHGKGAINTKGYSLGGTLTWYGNSGAYLDSQVQVTRYDSDLGSSTARRRLVNNNDGMGYALSVEGGKRFALGGSWSLTPQAQLSYSSVKFDDFTDPFGADVSLDKSESLVGRLGVAIDHETEWTGTGGQTGRSRIYGIANLYYDFADGSRVNVGATPFKSRNDALRGGVGVGWSLNSSDDKYSVYAEALVNTSLKNLGDSNEVKGTVGVRMRW